MDRAWKNMPEDICGQRDHSHSLIRAVSVHICIYELSLYIWQGAKILMLLCSCFCRSESSLFANSRIPISTYSEIPLLRPPKIKTFYLLKTLLAKFKLFFSSFSTPSVPLIRDYLWDCPKVVFKTTFGQSQRWS